LPAHILSIISRVVRPPIITTWRRGIIPVTMPIGISTIISIGIIRFIIRIGNSNPYAVKPMTIVNPNGASAEDNQEPY
jgi:hypothetical protein